MLATWCSDNNSMNWPGALQFIQASKNRRLHSGIGRSPYQAMFGRRMTMGISDDGLSTEELEKIEMEEDLELVFNTQKRKEVEENNNEPILDPVADSSISGGNFGNDDEELQMLRSIGEEADDFPDYGFMLEYTQKEREGARMAQKHQAQKMLAASNKESYRRCTPETSCANSYKLFKPKSSAQ